MDPRKRNEILAAVAAYLDAGAPLIVVHAEPGQDAKVMTGSPGECRTVRHYRPGRVVRVAGEMESMSRPGYDVV